MVLTGARTHLWCPECASVQLCKVLDMNAGCTRITEAACMMCASTFDPQASDQGKDTGEDPGESETG